MLRLVVLDYVVLSGLYGNILLLRAVVVFIFILPFFVTGCSTIQTKSGDDKQIGVLYSGVQQAAERISDGPDYDHNYGPNGPIGVGALFIPVIDFMHGIVFYTTNSFDLLFSSVADTLFLPVDLAYQDDYSIDTVIQHKDIAGMIGLYQQNIVQKPALIAALANNDLSLADSILRDNPDAVNATDALGYSALFYAAASNNSEAVELVYAAGGGFHHPYAMIDLCFIAGEKSVSELMDKFPPDPTIVTPSVNFYSATFLTAALRNGYSQSAMQVIEQGGSDINHSDSDQKTPLSLALRLRDAPLVRALLSRGAETRDDGSLIRSVISDYSFSEEDMALFDTLTDFNATLPDDALAFAARNGSAPLTEKILLLTKPVDLNATDYAERSPLHTAAMYNNAAVIRVLVDAGMDVDIRNRSGETPLAETVGYDMNAEAFEALIKMGADANAAVRNDSYWGREPLLKYLLQYQSQRPEQQQKRRKMIQIYADSGKIDPEVLSWAVQSNDIHSAELFIEKGINVAKSDAVYYADDDAMLQLLTAHGADKVKRDRYKRCMKNMLRELGKKREDDADVICRRECAMYSPECP